jgi:hypothetical protein
MGSAVRAVDAAGQSMLTSTVDAPRRIRQKRPGEAPMEGWRFEVHLSFLANLFSTVTGRRAQAVTVRERPGLPGGAELARLRPSIGGYVAVPLLPAVLPSARLSSAAAGPNSARF